MDNDLPMQLSTPQGSFEDYMNQKPTYTGTDSMEAAFNSAWEGTAVGSLTRMYQMHEAKEMADEMGSSPQSPQDLNKQYPGLPQPFTEPTDPFTAGEIARRQTEQKQLSQEMQYGPQGKLYSVGRFGAGMLAHALDPVEMGANVATGFAADTALGATAVGAKIGFGVAEKSIPQLVGTGIVEGAAGTAATEPLQWYANKQDNTPNSAWQSAGNILMGGLMYGAIKGVGGAGARFLKRLNGNQLEMLHNVTTGQLANDKVPNPEPLEREFALEQVGAPPNADPNDPRTFNPDLPYTFKEIRPENQHTVKFYVPKDSVQASARAGNMVKVGDDFGNGLYMTDNPAAANGISGAKTLNVPGSIHEANLKGGANLLDLDAKLNEKNAAPFQKFLDEFTSVDENGQPDMTLKGSVDASKLSPREIYEVLREGVDRGEFHEKVLQDFNDAVQATGKDGIKYQVDETNGIKHDPYNVAMLFDKDSDKLVEGKAHLPNTDAVYKPPTDEVQSVGDKSLSHETDLYHEPEAEQKFQDVKAHPHNDYQRPDIETKAEELSKQIKEQNEQFKSPETEQYLKQQDELDKALGEREKMYKGIMNCLTRNG